VSDVSIAMICVTIIVWIVAKTYSNVKKITASVYEMTVAAVQNDSLPKSPYGVVRSKDYKGDTGYTITKNGNVVKIHGTEAYDVYKYMETAVSVINQYETIEGYRLTKV